MLWNALVTLAGAILAAPVLSCISLWLVMADNTDFIECSSGGAPWDECFECVLGPPLWLLHCGAILMVLLWPVAIIVYTIDDIWFKDRISDKGPR